MRAIYNGVRVSTDCCEDFTDFSNLISINTAAFHVTCLSQGVTHPQIKRCKFNGEVTSYQNPYLYRDRINFSFSVLANLIFHITAWYVSRLQW